MDVQIPHPSISLMHLRLFRQGRSLFAEDLGSTNGVRADGATLHRGIPLLLRPEARLELGLFELVLGSPPADGDVSAPEPEDTAAFARQMVLKMLGDRRGQSPSRLEVNNGAQRGARLEIPPVTAPLVIGRAAECDLVLRDADSSRRHLELRREGEQVVARDLGSKNGFQINGEVIRGERALSDGDELKIGQTALGFTQLARQETPRGREETPGEAPSSPVAQHAGRETGRVQPGTSGGYGRWLALSVGVGAMVLLALVALIYLLW